MMTTIEEDRCRIAWSYIYHVYRRWFGHYIARFVASEAIKSYRIIQRLQHR